MFSDQHVTSLRQGSEELRRYHRWAERHHLLAAAREGRGSRPLHRWRSRFAFLLRSRLFLTGCPIGHPPTFVQK